MLLCNSEVVFSLVSEWDGGDILSYLDVAFGGGGGL